MCGRLNVVNEPISGWIGGQLGIEFTTPDNSDLKPTQPVATLVSEEGRYRQLDTAWGITPHWSKRPIINAQAETVSSKRTFQTAFRSARCLVPCLGWYEWRDEGGPRKQRYSFTDPAENPLFMAGIYFNDPEGARLVTMTTVPSAAAAAIHHRMPLIIDRKDINLWLTGTDEQVGLAGAFEQKLTVLNCGLMPVTVSFCSNAPASPIRLRLFSCYFQ